MDNGTEPSLCLSSLSRVVILFFFLYIMSQAPATTPIPPAISAVPSADAKITVSSEAENNDASPPRLSKTTACLPIVFGSVAFYLGKKADDFQTHQWTLYIRGPNNEDLSAVVSKVVFQLHASFSQPLRELTTPPFEVTEKGWGEFEAQIRIIWKDPEEKPTVVNHAIKLYPPGSIPNVLPTTDIDVPVVAETYDEIVFTDPTEEFFTQLQRVSMLPKIEYSQQAHMKEFTDQDDFLALLEAQKFLQSEIEAVKERFAQVTGDLTLAEAQLQLAHEMKKAKPPSRKSRPASKKPKIS